MSESKLACPHCEQHIMIDDAWAGQTINCPSCQKAFQVPAAEAPAPIRITSQPASLRINRPSAPPPSPLSSSAPGATGAGPRYAPAPAVQTRTSGLAIASLILSIVGCFGLTAIAAVICGHIARKRIRNDAALTGGGMALAGLIIGYVMLAFSLFVVAGSVFLPALHAARVSAQRTVQEAQNRQNARGMTPPRMIPSATERTVAVPAGAVSGNIKGDTFNYGKSSLNTNMGLFGVSDGKDFMPDRDVKIFLFTKPGENLANRTWKITPSSTGMKPHVHLRWQENGNMRTDIVSSDYQLELKTGPINNGVISGSLDLKATGKTPAVLKGNFTAILE